MSTRDEQAQPVVLEHEAQRTAPKRIYLNLFGDAFDAAEPFPENHEGITWCEGEVGDHDVPYVRADLAAHPAAPQPQAAPLTHEQVAALTIMLDHYGNDPRAKCLRPLVYGIGTQEGGAL